MALLVGAGRRPNCFCEILEGALASGVRRVRNQSLTVESTGECQGDPGFLRERASGWGLVGRMFDREKLGKGKNPSPGQDVVGHPARTSRQHISAMYTEE